MMAFKSSTVSPKIYNGDLPARPDDPVRVDKMLKTALATSNPAWLTRSGVRGVERD